MVTKRNKWIDEEIEIMNKYYSNGLKDVLIKLSNHTKGSIKKKAKELNLKVDKYNLYYNVDIIKDIVKTSYSFAEVFRKMGKSKSGASYKVLRNFINRNNIDYSHFDPYKKNRNNIKNRKKPINYWLNNGTNIGSYKLKNKLYDEGLKERICEKCGQDENWKGVKIGLILDHINGINNDNRIENLRIVCPNCNAGLETHGGKNIILKRERNRQKKIK